MSLTTLLKKRQKNALSPEAAREAALEEFKLEEYKKKKEALEKAKKHLAEGATSHSGQKPYRPQYAAVYYPTKKATPQPQAEKETAPKDKKTVQDSLYENPFVSTRDYPLSKFPAQYQTHSYPLTYSFMRQYGTLPPQKTVRVEEFINHFNYDYAPPQKEHAFACHIEIASCPWSDKSRLVRVGVQGREHIPHTEKPQHFVFLVDTTASMQINLPLIKEALRRFTDTLQGYDTLSIITCGGKIAMPLPTTLGKEKEKIRAAIHSLHTKNTYSTYRSLRLAQQTVLGNLRKNSSNHVILVSEDIFSQKNAPLSTKKETFLALLKFSFFEGEHLHKNFLTKSVFHQGHEKNLHYIHTLEEGTKVLTENLKRKPLAQEVAITVHFNPDVVKKYRLIGYAPASEKPVNSPQDLPSIKEGHAVTALYEIIPQKEKEVALYPISYSPEKDFLLAKEQETLEVTISYKEKKYSPQQTIHKKERDRGISWEKASDSFRLSAAAAGFGMLLNDSSYKGTTSFKNILQWLPQNEEGETKAAQQEFTELIKSAEKIQNP